MVCVSYVARDKCWGNKEDSKIRLGEHKQAVKRRSQNRIATIIIDGVEWSTNE